MEDNFIFCCFVCSERGPLLVFTEIPAMKLSKFNMTQHILLMYDCFLAARIGRQPNSVRYARLIANRPVKEETSDVKIEPAVKIKSSFRPPEPHTSRPSVLPIIQVRNNPYGQDIPRRLQPLAEDAMLLPSMLTPVILTNRTAAH